jgi:hypothetical protein
MRGDLLRVISRLSRQVTAHRALAACKWISDTSNIFDYSRPRLTSVSVNEWELLVLARHYWLPIVIRCNLFCARASDLDCDGKMRNENPEETRE